MIGDCREISNACDTVTRCFERQHLAMLFSPITACGLKPAASLGASNEVSRVAAGSVEPCRDPKPLTHRDNLLPLLALVRLVGTPPLRPRHARIPTLIDMYPAATKGTDARHGKIRARRIAAPRRA
ncbi:hypothetical protein BVI434_670036 [Burkholderia vietnamiensis]|nr:hypothetical protein BVI434_670036 [Burkholderia vietnamiensis]